MYFSFPKQFSKQHMDTVSTDYLQQEEVHKKFMFRLKSLITNLILPAYALIIIAVIMFSYAGSQLQLIHKSLFKDAVTSAV